ncbi:hypothetical protein B0T18DRAFT_428194 [Schizothecium vesticola]|uniref:Uncharacterized protein n=1 Tax=Schizothecium vesticola TaxID=314040 RepID=A0AA40F2Z5_9PEZI|nr:hypothetical protein B0T18DRAFT_428194 [Schizothecium vesticola]
MHVQSDSIPCPFSLKACHPYSTPLQLDYINVSLRDVGLNFRSDILFSRRTICSLLNINHFLLTTSNGTAWFHLAAPNSSQYEDGSRPNGRQKLKYPDGRNPPPSKMHWLEERTPDLRYWSGSFQEGAHPDFLRPDAEVFILVYDAGRAVYRQPINDPMYSAHNRLRDQGRDYWPDYEYTAMACAEQYRLCLRDGACTDYTSMRKLSENCYKIDYAGRWRWEKPSYPFWSTVVVNLLISQQDPVGMGTNWQGNETFR